MFYSIQYLRAIAALMVVGTHIFHKLSLVNNASYDWFTIGSYGVDLFFIISGFIMCHSINGKDISLLSFMANRAKRILPLYWILTVLALIIYLYKPSLINSSGGEVSLFSSFTLIPSGGKLLINNGWTLSFEFLFYIIFAVSFTISSAYNVIASLIICSLVIFGFFYENNHFIFLFITSPFLLEFLIGMVIYKFYHKFGFLKENVILFASCAALSLVWFAYLNEFNFIEDLWGRIIFVGGPMSVLFTSFLFLEKFFHGKKFIMYNVGMSSYSLYLVHPFVLSIVTIIFDYFNILDQLVLYAITMLLFSCFLGWVCYHFIENRANVIINKINI